MSYAEEVEAAAEQSVIPWSGGRGSTAHLRKQGFILGAAWATARQCAVFPVVREALEAFITAFNQADGPAVRKPYPDGIPGTYLSPAGVMIRAEIAEQAYAALAALKQTMQ